MKPTVKCSQVHSQCFLLSAQKPVSPPKTGFLVKTVFFTKILNICEFVKRKDRRSKSMICDTGQSVKNFVFPNKTGFRTIKPVFSRI